MQTGEVAVCGFSGIDTFQESCKYTIPWNKRMVVFSSVNNVQINAGTIVYCMSTFYCNNQ